MPNNSLVLSHTVWPLNNTNCVLNRTSLYLRWLNFVRLRYRIALCSPLSGSQWYGGQLLPRKSYLHVFSFPERCILLSSFIVSLVSAQKQQPRSFVILDKKLLACWRRSSNQVMPLEIFQKYDSGRLHFNLLPQMATISFSSEHSSVYWQCQWALHTLLFILNKH